MLGAGYRSAAFPDTQLSEEYMMFCRRNWRESDSLLSRYALSSARPVGTTLPIEDASFENDSCAKRAALARAAPITLVLLALHQQFAWSSKADIRTALCTLCCHILVIFNVVLIGYVMWLVSFRVANDSLGQLVTFPSCHKPALTRAVQD